MRGGEGGSGGGGDERQVAQVDFLHILDVVVEAVDWFLIVRLAIGVLVGWWFEFGDCECG